MFCMDNPMGGTDKGDNGADYDEIYKEAGVDDTRGIPTGCIVWALGLTAGYY